MDRILRSTIATVTETFSEDGVVIDPGVVKLTVTSDNGTELITDVSTVGSGATARTYPLSQAQTADLDILRLDWTSEDYGTLTSYVEVVGGFYFTIAEARALKPLEDEGKYPTAAIIAMRTLVEEALEDACGQAFVRRYCKEQVSGNGTNTVLLANTRVGRVLDVTLDGSAVSATSAVLAPTGEIYWSAGWTSGFGNYSVRYEHGHLFPPARVKRGALRLAKRWLIEGPVDDRATSMTNDEGTFSLVTPGVRGALFDIPEVNALVEQYSIEPGIA